MLIPVIGPRTLSVLRILPIALTALLAACADEEADAYGNFEAREVTVSAEVGGRLLRFDLVEGEPLLAGSVVGQIDTSALALQKHELLAQQQASRRRTTEAQQQIAVLQAQLVTAREEYARTLRLFEAEAATSRQLNLGAGEVRVLEERIRAARAQTAAVGEDVAAVAARVARIDDQIQKSRISNPLTGTVLTAYVEAGEFVQPGAPLYRIANLDTLILRAYVSGAQLPLVTLGQWVEVRYDAGADTLGTAAGRVVWIASQAEFTPTPIQTRDERTEQVYAVKIHVENPAGVIKIGMPGEVAFVAPAGNIPSRPTAARPAYAEQPPR